MESESTATLLHETLKALMHKGLQGELRALLASSEPLEIANSFFYFSTSVQHTLTLQMPTDKAAHVFAELPYPALEALLEVMDEDDLKEMIPSR